jgi:hypothetical protein
MIYSEREYKLLLEENRKLKKENEIKDQENKLLKKQNKQQAEVIHDLDKNNYRGQCETLKLENKELKKKTQDVRRKIRAIENQSRKKQQ